MPRRGRARRRLVTAFTALVLLGSTAPLRAETDPTTLPPQPGSKAGDCASVLGAPNTWNQIGGAVPIEGNPDTEGFNLWLPKYRTVNDPAKPCLSYRVSGDARGIERSSNGAKTWQPVFFDGRTSTTGAPMRITGLYAPAPGVVYASEDGNGVSMVRSLDAGATWAPANRGLAGKPVRQAWFGLSDARVGYALVLTGGVGQAAEGAAAEVYATTDGGASWRATAARLAQANLSTASVPFSVAVDPADAAHVYVAYSQGGAPDAFPQKPGAVMLESHDYGQSFNAPIRLNGELVELLAARRPSGSLRLYWLVPRGLDGGIRFSDDNGASWTPVVVEARFNWLGGLVDPVAADKVLYFGTPYFEAKTGLVALYSRDGFKTQELGEQPNAIQSRRYILGHSGVDRYGQYYIDVGIQCETERCDPNGAASGAWLSWRTYRFRPPDPGQALVLDVRPTHDNPAGGQFQQLHKCTIGAAGPEDDAGSLAFDGSRLYFGRRLEAGPVPYSGVVRIADPTACKETGRLIVHFDAGEYEAARKRAVSDSGEHAPLLPPQPSVDSISYDQARDELWLSVPRMADTLPPFSGSAGQAPFPVWSIPRGGNGPDRQAHIRFWTQPCGPGGVGLLANDRVSGTLWTCDGKVPGELTGEGKSKAVCLHPLFAGSQAKGEVWQVQAWGVGSPGTLIVVRNNDKGAPNRRVEQYDARHCRHIDSWDIPIGEFFPAPKGPEFLSLQVVCDPVTFRGEGEPAAVAWMRHGSTFYAHKAPDLSCPSPTAAAYSGPVHVDPGHRLDACATVTVPGPGAPLPKAALRISVADGPAKPATSDAGGRACVPYDVPVNTPQGTRLAVKADVAPDAHLLGSAVTGSVLVGAVPITPAPVVLPPPPAPAPPPIPFPPAPAPAPAPQTGVQPAASPPGQAVSQQGLASEKEREVQLAHAQQESSGEEASSAEPATEPVSDNDDSYAFVAVLAGALGLGALALGRVAGLAGGAAPSYSTVSVLAGARRKRRRRR